MTIVPLYIYGASGHGKVVADAAAAAGQSISGFIDDAAGIAGTQVLQWRVLGDWDRLVAAVAEKPVAVALGIGDNAARESVAERCQTAGIRRTTVVHPSAQVSPSASLGEGTVILAGAAVNPDASVGAGCIVNTGAVVEHDCRVDDFAHLSPNAAIGGAAILGARSHIGLGALVLPGVVVGADTWVGAGTVVVRDLPESVVAMGVPARVSRRRE